MTDNIDITVDSKIVSGAYTKATDRTNYELASINHAESKIVFRELASHVREGHPQDGRFNYYFYGATEDLDFFGKLSMNLFTYIFKKYDSDDIKATLHRSCAFSVSDQLKGYTLTYIPSWKPQNHYKITYLTQSSQIAEVAKMIDKTNKIVFSNSLFLRPDLEIIEEF